jgi:hypothetical protein
MSTVFDGILTLTAPRTLEEELVDFFLDREHQHGFTSLHVRGHSLEHSQLTPIEQVTGRQHQVQFQVQVNETEAQEICKRLETRFSGTGIHYWFLISTLQGHI